MPRAVANGISRWVITAAPTREGAKELVLDALREYLLSLTEESAGAAGEREPVALTITA